MLQGKSHKHKFSSSMCGLLKATLLQIEVIMSPLSQLHNICILNLVSLIMTHLNYN